MDNVPFKMKVSSIKLPRLCIRESRPVPVKSLDTPILVCGRILVDGLSRLELAKSLGLTDILVIQVKAS